MLIVPYIFLLSPFEIFFEKKNPPVVQRRSGLTRFLELDLYTFKRIDLNSVFHDGAIKELARIIIFDHRLFAVHSIPRQCFNYLVEWRILPGFWVYRQEDAPTIMVFQDNEEMSLDTLFRMKNIVCHGVFSLRLCRTKNVYTLTQHQALLVPLIENNVPSRNFIVAPFFTAGNPCSESFKNCSSHFIPPFLSILSFQGRTFQSSALF